MGKQPLPSSRSPPFLPSILSQPLSHSPHLEEGGGLVPRARGQRSLGTGKLLGALANTPPPHVLAPGLQHPGEGGNLPVCTPSGIQRGLDPPLEAATGSPTMGVRGVWFPRGTPVGVLYAWGKEPCFRSLVGVPHVCVWGCAKPQFLHHCRTANTGSSWILGWPAAL